jgi:integrase
MPTPPTHPELAEFLDEVAWSTNTITNAMSNLRRWERVCAAAGVDVVAADHTILRNHLRAREAAGIGSETRHKEWQHVTAFYRWAATAIADGGPGLLTANPMLRVKAPAVVVRDQRTADVTVADRLVEHFGAIARQRRAGGEEARAWRDAAIVSMMMRAGVRSNEIGGIDAEHLVRDGRGQLVACHVLRTKNGAPRLVPLTDELPRLLARYLRRRGTAPGPLFAGRAGHTRDRDGRLSAAAVQQMIRRGANKCGITVSAHDFRRGWAVASAERGVDRGWLKIVGGWDKDVMLDRYLGPAKRQLAVDEFHAALGRPGERAVTLRRIG